jgi:hypothetical protein
MNHNCIIVKIISSTIESNKGQVSGGVETVEGVRGHELRATLNLKKAFETQSNRATEQNQRRIHVKTRKSHSPFWLCL